MVSSPHLLSLVSQKEKQYAAFVIACYSDPGLHSVREATKKPVLGISECGILTALTLGHSSASSPSCSNPFRGTCATSVHSASPSASPASCRSAFRWSELSNQEKTFGRMVEVGKALRERHGADVVVMGCAGMARYRKPLQDEIGVPVVEPTQAAVAMAIGRVRLNWNSGSGS